MHLCCILPLLAVCVRAHVRACVLHCVPCPAVLGDAIRCCCICSWCPPPHPPPLSPHCHSRKAAARCQPGNRRAEPEVPAALGTWHRRPPPGTLPIVCQDRLPLVHLHSGLLTAAARLHAVVRNVRLYQVY